MAAHVELDAKDNEEMTFIRLNSSAFEFYIQCSYVRLPKFPEHDESKQRVLWISLIRRSQRTVLHWWVHQKCSPSSSIKQH